MLQDDSIYIAGHSGLIGSALLKKFHKEKYTNIHIKTRNELDLTNRGSVDDFFSQSKPKYVFLAAGKVGGIIENNKNPADFIISNLLIQNNIMLAALNYKVRRLIFFGSSCMYPKSCKQPMNESMLMTGKPEPTSIAYAVAKLAGMQTCISINKQFKQEKFLPFIPNSVYGPNDNFDPNSSHVLSSLINKFYKAKKEEIDHVELWGSGQPRREFIYSDDLADACYFLVNQKKFNQLPINIGVGIDFSISELASIIASEVGFKGRIIWDKSKPDGAPRKLLDSSYLNSLGWKSNVNLRNGIKKTIKWYEKEKVK